MDTKLLPAAKRDLEHRLLNQIADALAEFKQCTGLSVSSMDISFQRHQALNDACPDFIVAAVDVDINI